MSITFTTTQPGGPELNLANGNAAQALQFLGLSVDGDGECDAEDFLGRVLIAQGLLDITTDDEQGRPTVTDGRFTWYGTSPGYLAGRLAELHHLATWAHHHHGQVVWA